MEKLVVFDMDGVLAEVTESYRQGIVETVFHFTGHRIERDAIQEYKIAAAGTTIGRFRRRSHSTLGLRFHMKQSLSTSMKFSSALIAAMG